MDALSDSDWSAMLRLMSAEAEAIRRAARKR